MYHNSVSFIGAIHFVNNLKNWYKSGHLLSIVKIICFNRIGTINNRLSLDYEFVDDFNYNISSSKIRSLILNNDIRVKKMINKNIFNYIMKEKLYK